LLAGTPRLTDAVGWHLAVLVVAQLLIGAALAVAMILAGTAVVGSLLYGAAVALVGVVFAALGTMTAQLVPSRQTAAGLAGAILGAGLLLRMIADGAASAAWLRWVTPFGLVAQVQPYAADRVAPVVVLAAAGGGLSVLATMAALGRTWAGV
jgi:ABC-2 type transport system permease protein